MFRAHLAPDRFLCVLQRKADAGDQPRRAGLGPQPLEAETSMAFKAKCRLNKGWLIGLAAAVKYHLK